MIKTAIVGLGPHGQRIMVACKQIDAINLVALVDRNIEVLTGVSMDLVYTDYSKMLSEQRPECVIISTNGPSHYVLAMEAIKVGVKYLLVSKPLTCRLAEAIKLFEMARKNSVRVAVDHGLRYDTTFEYVSGLIKKGTFGTLLHVYIMRNGIGLGCLGVHSFDLANSLFGSFPNRVSAWVDEPVLRNPRGDQFVDPGGTVILKYPNGRRAIIEQSEAATGSFFTEIHGTKGKLQLDSKTGRVVGQIKSDQGLEDFKLPEGMALMHDTITLMKRTLESLIGNQPIRADIEVGLRSVEILVAAYQSAENGNVPVSLPVTDEKELNRFLPVT